MANTNTNEGERPPQEPNPNDNSSSNVRPTSRQPSPDVVAENGVLRMLRRHSGRVRAVSKDSRRELGSRAMQAKYNESRNLLSSWLKASATLLEHLRAFASENDVFLPNTRLTMLNTDIRMGQAHIGSSSEKSVAPLLEQALTRAEKHVQRVLERIENTTSHVLVTGDLNAGKSSLCNAILRRDVLPVDQQPCTDVFCEVIDATQNEGREEVHAIYLNHKYHRNDLTSYKIFAIKELDNLVHKSDVYSLLKVYILDQRGPETSILSNGMVDICLIDAPGLNVDVNMTAELFGRQEEIDLVIFVVSAENHFTQSSKEFVADTAREKNLVFVVINNYDKIRDKDRCKTRIMKQVAELVPETHKGAGDFVHFVSSESPHPPNGDPNPGDHGPGTPDFDLLELSLRNFVMKKRSVSKLAPAKTLLVNLLGDLQALAETNAERAQLHFQQISEQLDELGSSLDTSIRDCVSVTDKVDRDIEKLSQSIYTQTLEHLSEVVDNVATSGRVEYTGFLDAFSYAARTREAIVNRIQQSVSECEENAREITASAVEAIKTVGIQHVGEQPVFSKVFQKSVMFNRRRDDNLRKIQAPISFTDFLDFTGVFERPLPIIGASKANILASSSTPVPTMLTVASLLGGSQFALGTPAVRSILNGVRWLDWQKIRALAIPVGVAALVGMVTWVVSELPRTIPRKLARKVALEVDELGYVTQNAGRISAECRKVLRHPSHDLRSAFQTSIEKQSRQQEEFRRYAEQASDASDYFSRLFARAGELDGQVRQCVLEFDLTVD